jgi:adenylate kinase family enzyme
VRLLLLAPPGAGKGTQGERLAACSGVRHIAAGLSVGEDRQRTMMIASTRYLDVFVKQDSQWLFADPRLMVNWTETRPSAA